MGKMDRENGKVMTESGGTDGPVSRIYDSFHYGNKIANELQQVWYFYLSENADGDMDLFYHNGIYYIKTILYFSSKHRRRIFIIENILIGDVES